MLQDACVFKLKLETSSSEAHAEWKKHESHKNLSQLLQTLFSSKKKNKHTCILLSHKCAAFLKGELHFYFHN